MSIKRVSCTALLVAMTMLAACSQNYGAQPIRTGNDRTVVSGGPGGFMGGAVGTLPAQGGTTASQPADTAPVSDTSASDTLAMPDEAPAVPVTPVQKTSSADPAQPAQLGCDFASLEGKPLDDTTVTKLIRDGRVVRELKPGDAVTMEYLQNRVNVIVDPKSKNVVDVTCG